jgi:cytochrome c oxidase cbb3-type subunit 3
MKFRNYLESIEGVSIYPMIGLLISIVVFVAILVWVWTLDKKDVQKMKNIPLDLNDKETSK